MFCKGIGSFKIFPFVVLEQEHHINGRQDFGTKQVSQTYVVYSFQTRTSEKYRKYRSCASFEYAQVVQPTTCRVSSILVWTVKSLRKR